MSSITDTISPTSRSSIPDSWSTIRFKLSGAILLSSASTSRRSCSSLDSGLVTLNALSDTGSFEASPVLARPRAGLLAAGHRDAGAWAWALFPPPPDPRIDAFARAAATLCTLPVIRKFIFPRLKPPPENSAIIGANRAPEVSPAVSRLSWSMKSRSYLGFTGLLAFSAPRPVAPAAASGLSTLFRFPGARSAGAGSDRAGGRLTTRAPPGSKACSSASATEELELALEESIAVLSATAHFDSTFSLESVNANRSR
mmetsp:Transcript_40573/g.106578  ORF Transcript_40573/g.106578 Transcript_40573/m.106578 type:complete len:256 (-) Transcript_40573:237-1004(-)